MLVTNNACARRVLVRAEELRVAHPRLDDGHVEELFALARGADGKLDKGGAEALTWVRREVGLSTAGEEAFADFAKHYGLDAFVEELKANEAEAQKRLARAQDDWKEFVKRDDVARTSKKSDRVRSVMKKLRATKKQTTEVVVRTGHVGPNAQDPAEVGEVRALNAKTRL
jgi:hypothetical protein